MSYKNEINFEQQLNLKNILSEFISKWYIFVLVILVSVVSQFIYTSYFITPTYDSTAKIYIMNMQSENVSTADISISTYLTKDYEELIKDDVILQDVSEQLGGVYSASQIRSSLSIRIPENTRILEMTVRTAKPETSKKIVDCICKVSQQKIVELMGIDRVNIIRNGNINKSPSSPNFQNRIFVSALFGFVLSALIVFLISYSNSKIRSEEDVDSILNLTVLATIPYSKKNNK